MISGTIYIKFVDEPDFCGLSAALLPEAKDYNAEEEVMWHFLMLGYQAATKRLTEQMVNNSTRGFSKGMSGGPEAEAYRKKMREAGLLNRIAGNVTVMRGLYTCLHAPYRNAHPLEQAAWETIKRGFDIASDEFSRDGFWIDLDESERQLGELLEEELAKLPIYEKVETKHGRHRAKA